MNIAIRPLRALIGFHGPKRYSDEPEKSITPTIVYRSDDDGRAIFRGIFLGWWDILIIGISYTYMKGSTPFTLINASVENRPAMRNDKEVSSNG